MIVLTMVLFFAALAMGLLAWRLWRDERRRFGARVAALVMAIEGPEPNLRDLRSASDPFDNEVAAAAPPKELFFEARRRSAVQGRTVVKVAAGLGMAVTVTVLIAMTSVRRDIPAAAPIRYDSSLELLSMHYTRRGETLTVSGVVRNPGRAPVQGVAAVVIAFDRSGDFLASSRAPLDESILRPGGESPFQVLMTSVGDVGRYRVSFRTEAGVIRHVDRRREGPATGGRPGLRAARD